METVTPSGTLTATWAGIPAPTSHDWFVVVPVGAADSQWVQWWYTTGAASGSVTQPLANLPAGTYELRLFANDTLFTRLGVSNPFTMHP